MPWKIAECLALAEAHRDANIDLRRLWRAVTSRVDADRTAGSDAESGNFGYGLRLHYDHTRIWTPRDTADGRIRRTGYRLCWQWMICVCLHEQSALFGNANINIVLQFQIYSLSVDYITIRVSAIVNLHHMKGRIRDFRPAHKIIPADPYICYLHLIFFLTNPAM